MWLIRNELDKPSVVHGELDIGHGGQIPIVGYHHKGLLKLIAKGEEQLMKFLLVFGIQISRWLIGQDNLGLINKSSGHGNPLLLASESSDGLWWNRSDKPKNEQVACPLFCAFARFSGNVSRYAHILNGCEFGQQVMELKNKSNVLVPETCQAFIAQRKNIAPVDDYFPQSALLKVPIICSRVVFPAPLGYNGHYFFRRNNNINPLSTVSEPNDFTTCSTQIILCNN